MDNDLRQRDRNIAKRKRQLADSEKRITELDAIFKRLYEDSISGKLSDERFQKLSADYEKEEQELKVLASSLRKEVELEESKSADVDRFLSVVERCTDIPELTPCILHEFVEKIIVHAASDPKGKNRTQEIDIYYKGIGALEMSKVTASMEKRENGTAEAIPFSLSSRCFLIGCCIAALFVLLYAFALLRQMQIQISTACANTANIHIAVDFINRIQNHVISRNTLSNSRRTPRLHIIQRILRWKCSQILLYQSAKAVIPPFCQNGIPILLHKVSSRKISMRAYIVFWEEPNAAIIGIHTA